MALSNFEHKLDRYEQGIVDALRNNYDMEDAYDKFLEYRDVMKKLDRFESPEQKADIFAKAIQKGIKPDDWLRHIEKMDRARKNLYMNESPLLAQQNKEIERLKGQVQRLQKMVQSGTPNKPGKVGRGFVLEAKRLIADARAAAVLNQHPFKGARDEVRGMVAFRKSKLPTGLQLRGYVLGSDGILRRIQEGKDPFQVRVKTIDGDKILTVGDDSPKKAIAKKGQG